VGGGGVEKVKAASLATRGLRFCMKALRPPQGSSNQEQVHATAEIFSAQAKSASWCVGGWLGYTPRRFAEGGVSRRLLLRCGVEMLQRGTDLAIKGA
ncbi:MAG: hypothetical protein VW518_09320, partial [Burkholderiaceae bacterium]